MTAAPVVMNPLGVSPEAERRLEGRIRGEGADDPEPDYGDLAAVERWRRGQHEAWGEGTEPGEVEHEPTEIAGRPALVAGPPEAPVVLYLHAGGFCLGSPGTDAPITARLARVLRVVSLDYRLAPEHPFPAAIDDAEAAFRQLMSDHGRVGLAGTSAGGNLAVGVARRCRELEPAALALFCPHLDIGARRDRSLRGFEIAYLDGHDARDSWVSPAAATLEELGPLPPLLVQWTDVEPMAGDIAAFVETLATGTDSVTAGVWQRLWHAWHYHRELPEAWAAVDGAANWLFGALTAELG